MKKLFILTLTLVLALSLAACSIGVDPSNNLTDTSPSSAAAPSGTPENTAAPSVSPSETASGGQAAAFVRLLAGDTYHIKTHSVTAGVEINIEVYLKNGMYAQYYTSGGMSTINISRDGKLYTYYVADKSYSDYDRPLDPASALYNTSGLTYDSSGTADFGGKNLPYDGYTDAFGDTKQYFTDGSALVGIRVINSLDNSSQDTDVLALDQDIPDSAFDLPGGYTLSTPSPTSAPNPAVTLTTGLTLDQVEKNAEDAGYTVYDGFEYETREGAPAMPDTGFVFSHPDLFMSLYVMEFKSEGDAKAFADAMQSDTYHEYVQGKLVLEIEVSWADDGFTADKESQLVSALFK